MAIIMKNGKFISAPKAGGKAKTSKVQEGRELYAHCIKEAYGLSGSVKAKDLSLHQLVGKLIISAMEDDEDLKGSFLNQFVNYYEEDPEDWEPTSLEFSVSDSDALMALELFERVQEGKPLLSVTITEDKKS